jgi:AraC-like DNA-binding protein
MEQVPLHKLNQIGRAGLKVEDIGYANPYDYTQLHRHDYYEIILVEQGRGKQVIDFEESELQSLSVYIVFPGQVHLLQRSSDTKGWVLQFTQEVLFSNSQTLPLYDIESIIAQPIFFEELQAIFALLKQQLSTQDVASYQMARHYLHILLWKMLQAQPSKPKPTQTPSLLKQFLSLLDQHIAQNKTVKKYAEWLAVSPRKLNDACKNHWGKTGLQIIHERLLLEIKRLLMTRSLSHKEIAYLLEFDSPAAFSGFVKRKTSMTPTELQAQLEQIYK